MELLAETANKANTKTKDAELAKAMFEGTQQYRKKLKLPELNEYGTNIKEETDDMSFFAFFDDKIGRHYFCRFVQDVHPVHGNFLLQCGRYRTTVHEKRQIAQELCDTFVAVVTEIWSGEDADTILEAYKEGKKVVPKPGKKSVRQNGKVAKIAEAKSVVDSTLNRLGRGTPPDLADEMFNILKDDLDSYWGAFKQSKWMDKFACARQLEKHTVDQDDFHQFRVLGVGGFGAVHAAVKRDTGCLVAIKRMDKKLIKHKNRYKSCFTEAECLQQMSSAFVCGLHYTFQTKDDVCLVLDLLHGGTLSYLLTQKKKVSERCVCFFTACIIFAYEALHTKGFVYRDMKPANVLIKDNGYAVLIDFGLAAKVETALKGKCGTRGYWSPEMVKGDQYLYSGDWWSLGVTLVELLTGKKPFKKKFQKRKNTEDYVLICKEGKVDDKIEELDIEAKLGKAKEEEDDGRDSNDEETDEEDDDDAKKGRRTSVRVIGGFDKTVESMVETEAAFELMEAAITANAKLAAFKSDELEGGMERLIKIMSVVKYEGDTEIFKAGEFATFFCIVLEGTLKGEVVHNVGDVVGWEGLFKDNYHRPSAVKAGLMGGTLGICLYSELGRAKLFDEPVIEALKGVLCDANGGGVDAATLESTLAEFGEAEDTHAEERFIATQKHSKSGVDAAALAEKQKELSASKQRDQKIYLTQEVWAKKSLLDRTTQKFLGGLLTRDVNQRLGCGPGNFSKIKEHDFFTQNGPLGQINWDKLEDQSRTAPYIPKQEVNAKDESKMKTFNTAGMKKLAKEDEAKWGTWDWTSSDYFQNEMSAYLYEQWGLSDAKKGRLGGGSSGGCCAVS